MDLLNDILKVQKLAREDKIQSFQSMFTEEPVAVKAAHAKAKQVQELEDLKVKQEKELESLKDRHERENSKLGLEKEKESENIAIQKKRDATRKANESVELEESKVTCPECDGKGCDHCDDTGYHIKEGKLVTSAVDIIKLITKKVAARLEKEYSSNPEKGLGMINTIGSMVGHKVTDKEQQKGKLFLKFGEEVEEGYYSDKDKKQKATLKKHDKRMMKSAKDSIKKYEKGRKEETEVEEDRDYKKEYENYHSDPEQIKRRAKRNEARRTLKNRKDIKGKDVHHKDNNPMNNDKSNLSIVSQKFNRTEPRLRTEKLSKDATIGDFIKDFQNSDAPQFKNQSAEEIKKMAVAAYYANQKRG